MTDRIAARRGGALFVLVPAAGVLLTAGAVTLAYVFGRPPDGPPLVSRDIQSGQPFELELVSNGESIRVWLDMRCDSCAFPVEGAMTVSARGKELMSTEVSAGDSHDRAWGGHSRSLEQHLLFDADAPPAGEEITVKGSLEVRPPRDSLGAPVEGAPGPEMRLFRLSVTN